MVVDSRKRSSPAVTGRLVPPAPMWIPQSLATVGVGVAGAGALTIAGEPALATPSVVAGAVVGVLVGAVGRLRAARGELRDRLVEALCPATGTSGPDRRTVIASRWTAAWPGVPQRIVVRYASSVEESPDWRRTIVDAVGRVCRVRYRIEVSNPRRRELRLAVQTEAASSALDDLRDRIERTIRELIGPTARVVDLQVADARAVRVRVRHQASTKLAASGYRARVERTFSAVQEGRWRCRWDLVKDEVVFEQRPTFPGTIWLPPVAVDTTRDVLDSYADVRIPFGVDEDGRELSWRPAIDPNLMVVGSPGTGKALALDTPVPTPEGWTTMGAIRAGDRLFDESGSVCTVLAAHQVMVGRPCYRVRFSDGSEVVADAEHLWETATRGERRRALRSAPAASGRMGAEQINRIRCELQVVADDDLISIGEAARLCRLDPASRALRVVADRVGSLGDSVRVVPARYRYGRQMAPHSQGVLVADRDQVVVALGAPADDWWASRIASQGVAALCAGGPVSSVELRSVMGGWTAARAARFFVRHGIATGRESRLVQPVRERGSLKGVRTTLEIGQTLNRRHSVVVAGPLQLPERRLPIDPYVLGAWLGDGTSRTAEITTTDLDVLEEIGRTKRIPSSYLRAGERQRRDLLAGLLDTDGTVDPQGSVSFTTSQQGLANDVLELAATLGFRPTQRRRIARISGRSAGPVWTVSFTTTQPVFLLPRKRLTHQDRRPSSDVRVRSRYVVAVERVESVPVRCLTVDSPNSLFLVGTGLIPTHNTVFEHSILAGVARQGWPIWVVDGKSIEFLGWRTWPNVQVVATSIEQQVAVIASAWRLMEYRYQLIATGKAAENDFEPLMVFVDEFADIRANLATWYARVKTKGDPTKPPVLEMLASIARKGRSARVHLLFATQRPDAEYFGGDMRDNFRARISMGRLSPQGAMMMWQDPVTGTTVPRACRGRATTINDDNRPVEIQTYRTPDPRRVLHESDAGAQVDVLEALRPGVARHPRLMLLDPEPDPATGVVTYRSVERMAWVVAADYPELDEALDREPVSREQARVMSSPMAMLGLAGDDVAVEGIGTAGELMVREFVDDPELATDEVGAVDLFAGYGPVFGLPVEQVGVGDLIEVEPGRWATVDEDPDEDFLEPGCLAVVWRDDSDQDGLMSVPYGETVRVRKPSEEL